ncbi:phospho-sugar mutase [Gordonia sp. NPDC003950]
MSALIDRAREWVEHDPDAATRTELTTLIMAAQAGDDAALADLTSRFEGPLEFGTAGLRAAVGAGESRMNVAVVIRATAGLARYLMDTVGDDITVVVGCDAREGSSDFMDAALEVLSGAGFRALALPKRLPTPVTAFTVRGAGAEAGIMITASHNPPGDNGYKVYLGGRATDADGAGVQIVPPADAEIAARIATVPPADEVTRSTEGIVPLDPNAVGSYVTLNAMARRSTEPSSVRVVTTAMHGVGGATLMRVFDHAGITDVHPVPAQLEPDPTFPTVAFPNPEEPGALDLALALAVEVSADVVIALDPDADRCSVAIPQRDGSWRQLTGDELGALLGEQAAQDSSRSGDVLACSIVSSRMLGRIADAHGLRWAQTLTGFKWIARTPGLRFGYEEAIGYCTDPKAVRDKDGIGAAVRVVTLIEELAAEGKTLEDQLDHLARLYGLYATGQLSIRVADVMLIADAMARLRANGIVSLAGSPVVQYTDLALGDAGLPPTDGLLYRTAADDRVIIRPSGTEPKLKCYIEVVLAVDEAGDIPRVDAAQRIDTINAELATLLQL